MEQITKRDGRIYYGRDECEDIEDAYRRFRYDYNRRIGKAVHYRLDKLGRRSERVHGFGIIRESAYISKTDYNKKIKYRLLGLVCESYWWSLDITDIPEEIFEDVIEMALTKGSGMMMYVGKANRKKRKKRKPITLNF